MQDPIIDSSLNQNWWPQNQNKEKTIEKWSKFINLITKTADEKTPRGQCPYTIVCPPPNVTGDLHIGHCVSFTLIDCVARFQWLIGKRVLVQGGTDHAAIATTLMVRKHYKDQLTEENFQEKAREWIEMSQGKIKQQILDLGVLMQWDNFCYTLDEKRSQAVVNAFNILYNKGLIFKSKKIVNWDTEFATAISDLEVKMKEEPGILYEVPYLIEGEQQQIIVATTRPETIFADCALAIHPQDPRVADLHGKFAIIPLINRRIPIILSEMVEKDFGSGVLKITPAHCFIDNEIWDKHSEIKHITPIDLLDNHGKFTGENVPKDFINLNVKQGRQLVVKQLNLQGTTIRHSVPYSDRSGTVVECKITEQWFFDVSSLTSRAIEIVEKNYTRFVPESLINNYKSWLNNIKLWCISRDIPLGHQIPIWYDRENNVYCAHNYEEALAKARIATNNSNITLIQESFRLDTWFSSGLFHRSSLGIGTEPNTGTQSLLSSENLNYQSLFPGDLVVTGYDILFFWITRMILMSIALQPGDISQAIGFKNVLFHGLVRDKFGEKMSKTKNNVINPYEIAEIYGFDNLRLTLLLNINAAHDIKLEEGQFTNTNRILTKLKNAILYCSKSLGNVNLDPDYILSVQEELDPITIAMLQTTSYYMDQYKQYMEKLEVGKAVRLLINEFFYGEFCDQFIEIHKNLNNSLKYLGQAMYFIVNEIIKMLHPLIPFQTENIWELLPWSRTQSNKSILHSKLWGGVLHQTIDYRIILQSIKETVSLLRFIEKALHCKNIKLNIDSGALLKTHSNIKPIYIGLIASLARVVILPTDDIHTNDAIQYLDLLGNKLTISNITIDSLVKTREISKLTNIMEKIKKSLDSQHFLKNSPEKLVEQYKNEYKSKELFLNCLLQIN